MFNAEVEKELKAICLEIAKRYEIVFLEIGTDRDHVRFLVPPVPTYSPTKIVHYSTQDIPPCAAGQKAIVGW